LLGQRQDGDPRQVHLLVAGQRQEEIERPFEAVDIDNERLAVATFFELVEACLANAISDAMSVSKRASSAARSTSPAVARLASAASARLSDSPASSGTASAIFSIC
jgi:hypothetical protein